MMTKMVDGKVIELTPEEEAALLVEWDKRNAERSAEESRKTDLQNRLYSLKQSLDVTPNGNVKYSDLKTLFEALGL